MTMKSGLIVMDQSSLNFPIRIKTEKINDDYNEEDIQICSVTSENPEYNQNDNAVQRNNNVTKSYPRRVRRPIIPIKDIVSKIQPSKLIKVPNRALRSISAPATKHLTTSETTNENDSSVNSNNNLRKPKLLILLSDENKYYFACQFCCQAFLKRSLLFNHFADDHSGIYVCKTCCYFFRTKIALTSHNEFHKQKRQEQKECPFCFIWVGSHSFSAHCNNHFIFKFKCTYCGFKTFKKTLLEDHERHKHNLLKY